MVFILKEKDAKKIFASYSNVAAFTFGKSKGINEDNGLSISYAPLNFMPDDDEINAVLAGDVKAKKVIAKAVKALYNPTKSDNRNLCISMAQLVNLVSPEKGSGNRKGGPNILVFVLDEADDAKAKNKFLSRFITALFAEFGIETVTSEKVVKKLFKVKNPAKKKQRRKVVENVIKFIDKNESVRINKKGYVLKKMIINFFALELHQASLAKVHLSDINRKQRENLVKALKNVYTNDNLQVIDRLGLKKKDVKRLCKSLKKKNKEACEAYNSLVEILKLAGVEVKFPKVKNGWKGKKPKMDTKKFAKFFDKKKNYALIPIIYAHTTCVGLGVMPGDKEYSKYLSAVTSQMADGFSKAFAEATKTYAKTVAAK